MTFAHARLALVTIFSALFAPTIGYACPRCATGELARQQAYEQGFELFVLGLAPFALVAASCAYIEQFSNPERHKPDHD